MAFTNIWGDPKNVLGGGTWNMQVGMQDESMQGILKDMFAKLRSPDEYNKLPDGIRNAFGGYMGYVNAFASRQRATRDQQAAYGQAGAGTFEPQQYQTLSQSYGGEGKRIPVKSGGVSGSAIPRTTTHKDIRGRVTATPIGGGMRTDMQGNVIPETLEAIEAGEELQYAVPTIREKSAIDLLRPRSERVSLEANIALPKRELEMQKEQRMQNQGQQKLNLTEAEMKNRNVRFYDALEARKKIEADKPIYRKQLMELQNKFNTASDEAQRIHQRAMARMQGKNVFSPEFNAKRQMEIEDDLLKLRTQSQLIGNRDKLNEMAELEKMLLAEQDAYGKMVLGDQLKNEDDAEKKSTLVNRAAVNQQTRQMQTRQKLEGMYLGDDYPDEASARKAGHKSGETVYINGRPARLN